MKCDHSGQTSLKPSAVTRHHVPKNMITTRAMLVLGPNKSATFARSASGKLQPLQVAVGAGKGQVREGR